MAVIIVVVAVDEEHVVGGPVALAPVPLVPLQLIIDFVDAVVDM